MVRGVLFDCGKIRLSGLLAEAPGDSAVVVTHPHPLYGGDMENNVVAAIEKVFAAAGHATLRFNFRGVGQSGGVHDEGRGEQDDLAAAFDFLLGRGKREIWLAGYSFGSWVNALASERLGRPPMILVAPPVALLEFPEGPLPGLKAVAAGQHDQFGPPDRVREAAKAWNPAAPVLLVPGADHFFGGSEDALRRVLETFLSSRKS